MQGLSVEDLRVFGMGAGYGHLATRSQRTDFCNHCSFEQPVPHMVPDCRFNHTP